MLWKNCKRGAMENRPFFNTDEIFVIENAKNDNNSYLYWLRKKS